MVLQPQDTCCNLILICLSTNPPADQISKSSFCLLPIDKDVKDILCKEWPHSKLRITAGIKEGSGARQQGTSWSRRAIKPRRSRAANTPWLLHVEA